ncbi:helix-turn-helix domain-containing protein [Acinetobacter sp. Ver3]|uniref:helix-turn-helix domain-containing protein n=1 Tax=Acinetobacter sp. Ver3 TaxID=466088 RepID=UPI00044EE9DE|nr:helix-turn-helix domain-containing protein [Acinetobacter sp. Ver3]EZQ10786.1 hypothetical protein CL42_06425 [Acinetobacter sp. Ver3]
MKSNLAYEPSYPQGEVVRFPKNERKAMSEKKFNYVTSIRSIKMHSTTKHVALTLATYADFETGICYPTIQTLMDDTGLSNRVVSHHIKQLEKLGFLLVKRARGSNSKYKFVFENITKAMTQSHHLRKTSSDFDDMEVVTLMHEVVTLSAQSSDAESHKHPLTTNNYHEVSDSVSAHEKTEQKTEGEKQTKPTAKKRESGKVKTSIPKNFAISDQVRTWAQEKNYKHLEQHLEYFTAKCEANGYKYLNWDAAFKTAIRDDWAKLNNNRQTGYQSAASKNSQTLNNHDAFFAQYGIGTERQEQAIDVNPDHSYAITWEHEQ